MSSRKWFGIAAVTALPGFITTLATINGCVGDDPVSTPADTDSGATSSSSGSTSSSGASGSSSGSTVTDSGVPPIDPDAAPSLGCPLGCLPPAPAGWTGPSATYDGPTATKPAACPSQYTAKEVEGHQGMTVGATTCDCGSGTNSGAKCTSVAERYITTDCTGTAVAQSYDAVSGKSTCVDRMSGTYSSFKIKTGTIARGSCNYNGPKVTGPAPSFDKENVSCGLPQFAVCSQKADCVATPIPDQPFTRLCIHKEGDLSCPSLDFTARFLVYKSSTDDRACSCTGNPTGGACGTATNNNKSASCGLGGIGGTVESCMSGAVNGTDIAGTAPSGITCPAGAMSGSTGSVKDAEPVTFCCNK